MIRSLTTAGAVLLLALHATADSAVVIESDETVVQVKGVVCSFCAQGVQRSLGKLDGLDEDRFEDGVLVDIDNQRVSLAFSQGVVIPFAEICEEVRDGGYEPVRFHVRVRGTALREDDGWRVARDGSGQVFALADAPEGLEEGSPVDLQAVVSAEQVAELAPSDPVPALVEKVFSEQAS